LTTVRCAARGTDELGEGPAWSAAEGRVYWFDIQGRCLNWFEPTDGHRGRYDLPFRASVATPCRDGGLVLVTEKGLGRFDTLTGKLEIKAPMDLGHGFRTNDGKIDVAGRLWWSSMDEDRGQRPGKLFRTDPDGTTHVVIDNIHIANTVSCTPQGDGYYLADSFEQTIWRFPMSRTGDFGPRAIFATTVGDIGTPDGSAVDEAGYLWNAQWGAGWIVRYAPNGHIDQIILMPVSQPSSCAFGGPDLATLYVTSAREGLSPADLMAQPLAGSLFAFEPGVRGLALPVFPETDTMSATYPSLKDKVVFITGGATGIGAAMVEAFHAQGSKVGFLDRDREAGMALKTHLPGSWFATCDVTDTSALAEVLIAAQNTLGPIQVLVNNVADDTRHTAAETSADLWRRQLAVNLDPIFLAARAVHSGMKAAGGGVILNLSSINALLGPADMPAYVAAKGAVNALTKALAREWGGDNVRVNTISPGWVVTERQLALWLTPQAEAEWMKQVALQKRLMPQDIAALALFLASDDAAMITGQNHVIDGGRT